MRSIYNATGNLFCTIILLTIVVSLIGATRNNLSEIEEYTLIGKNVIRVILTLGPPYVAFWIGFYIVTSRSNAKRSREIHDLLRKLE